MPTPRRQSGGLSTAIPVRFRGLVHAAAAASGVPQNVVAAQIDLESAWNPHALSPTGAQGIAQFEPATWRSFGRGSPDNPKQAFPAYARFMRYLLKQTHGNLRDALAAYNAGPNNIPAGYGYADEILRAAGASQGTTTQLGSPYRNPLRGVRNLQPERVDMGVDYGGSGPIYALGPGRITEAATGNTGWGPPAGLAPGGYVKERLTAGPLKGHYVYVAEGIQPAVKVGQKVTAATKIGTLTGSGIETGFAAPGAGTAALGASQFSGSNPTAYGAAYSNILADLGAPPGTVSGQAVGKLPSWLQGFATAGQGIGGGGLGIPNPLSGLGSIGSAIQGITDWLGGLSTAIDWLINPENWVRIIAGVGGGALVIGGVVVLSHTGEGMRGPLTSRPAALPVGILMVGSGGVLLFIAFHNLESPGSSSLIGETLGSLRDQAQAATAGQQAA